MIERNTDTFDQVAYMTARLREHDRATAHKFQWTVETEGWFLDENGHLTVTPDPHATFRGARKILIAALRAWFKAEFERSLYPSANRRLGGWGWPI